jgi:hypothetical protein
LLENVASVLIVKQIRFAARYFAFVMFAVLAITWVMIDQQSAHAQSAPGSVSEASSLEKCEFPGQIGDWLVAPGNRGGEYRIKLSIGSLSNADVIRRHLLNATVFARLLTTQLRADTGKSCDAGISSIFPDLRAYLIDESPVAKADAGPSRCGAALIKAAQSMPTPSSVSAAAAKEGNWRSSLISGGGIYITAINILEGALRQIYVPDSFMHTLVSVDASAYSSFDTEDFLKWLRTQQVEGGPTVSKIPICGSDVDPTEPGVDHPWQRLPASAVAASGTIRLSTEITGPVAIPALRHVVVVGDKRAAPDVASSSLAFHNYCDREHVFSKVGAARIRCFGLSPNYVASWIVLFCDPSDCSTESVAEAVMAGVAEDPTIDASGKESAANGQPRGPYLIHVETSH